MGPLGRDAVPMRETYALRWAGREAGVRPSLTIEAARATSFEEFRRVAQHSLTGLGMNIAYADVDGTIGSCTTGRFPVRAQGDGTAPVPGWDGEHEWTGWIPADELPWIENPERGFLVTANNRVHDDAYPHLIGLDFHPPFRARRIAELLEQRSDHDVASMGAIQTDTVSLPARAMLPALLAQVKNGDAARAGALDLLRNWDGDLRADSAAAAVFTVWSGCIARRALGDVLGDDLFRAYHAWREPWHHRVLPSLLETPSDVVPLDGTLLGDALDDALSELHERLGDDPAGWRWGTLHRARFAHPLAGIPGLESLFVAADVELGGDEQTVLQGGMDTQHGYGAAVVPSWRVVWDLSDPDRSAEVLATGNSGNPASPHWADQSPAWSEGRLLPVDEPHDSEDPVLRLLPASS
jgi:penicillin amidase